MLEKVLIANRGEIAVRIIRTACRLGIETVLAVSEADRNSLAAEMADEVVLIGPPTPAQSYLRIDRIVEAAKRTGADAIHPGYGFLAENAGFAAAVSRAGIRFVGPSAAAMQALGSKAAAKTIAAKAAIPVIPGYQGDKQDLRTLRLQADRIGYPVVIKAVAGGGGRGMRIVEREAEFAAALESAQREANSAFGDGRVLIEKLVERPRHIEVQVFGDRHGNVVHLFERDCTLQRRHQKVIEEAPAPGMTPELRAQMTVAAVTLARAVGYEGAGTIEFLVEAGTLDADARWYFIEANTRLQVEHPVTEAITGLDLVEWQLRIAGGEKLPLRQDQIVMSGHAIEARLCAEDPARSFMPSTGRLVEFVMPAGPDIRVDTGVRTGDEISPYYDSMIAKIITHEDSREAAIARQLAALDAIHVAGPRTNAAFLRAVLMHPDVANANMDTGLIGRNLDMLAAPGSKASMIAVGLEHMLEHVQDDIEAERLLNGGERSDPWRAGDGFQLAVEPRQIVTVLVDGVPTQCEVRWGEHGPAVSVPGDASPLWPSRHIRVAGVGNPVFVQHDLWQMELRWPSYAGTVEGGEAASTIRAPINGRVAKLFVEQGARIEKGARIAVIEAMKMEHVLPAPRAGTLSKLGVKEGQQVAQGALIATLAEEGVE